MRTPVVLLVFLLITYIVSAQPGLEAYDRGDLEAVRTYLASGKGADAETDFLRAALTVDGDSAADLFRGIIVKYPDSPMAKRARERLQKYYYAKGLYTKAQETEKSAAEPIKSAPQAETPNTPIAEPEPEVPQAAVNPPPEPEPVTAPALSGYVLQLGAFANAENVRKLKNNLEKAGYKVEVVPVVMHGKPLQAVRAVGYKDQDTAQAAAAAISKKFGLNPVLIPTSDKP